METPQLNPSPELEERIVSQIKREKSLSELKKRLFRSAFGLSLALAAFTFSYRDFLVQIAHSGFLRFFNLAFSDFQIVTLNGADYALSLLESLPVVSFGALSLTGLVVLFLGYKLLKYAFQIRHLKV